MARYIDADELVKKSIRIEGHFDLPSGKAQNFSAIDVTEILDFPPADVAPVKQGYIVWKKRHRGGFRTTKCLHHFNDINMEHNTPCKHIAQIDERYTINEPYCSECGKLLGDFLNYCGNCGAKMDGDKNAEMS